MCAQETGLVESPVDLEPQGDFIFPYICPFGNVIIGLTDVENTERCFSCNDSYDLEEIRCVRECTTDEIVTKLQEDPLRINGCNVDSSCEYRCLCFF